ncbi:MAG TPA: ABC transporter permease subunit [archaeon]|nr:ABC transporter permease subunit [archaeon]
MKLWKSWTVAMKDFSVFKRKKYIIYSLVATPLILSLLLPGSILLTVPTGQIPSSLLTSLISSEFSIFIILAAILPTVIASYSFIGEKVEKSLEPLLATPTTDGELLLGKSLAAFLPSISATYVGAIIFMVFVDTLTYGQLGHLLLPDLNTAVILVLAAPLACILSVEFNVIISSRVNDVRTGQQLGGLVILPLLAIFIIGETNPLAINASHLLIISGILLAADIALSYLTRATFQREEILTKWK